MSRFAGFSEQHPGLTGFRNFAFWPLIFDFSGKEEKKWAAHL
jgi:hypothetical protein